MKADEVAAVEPVEAKADEVVLDYKHFDMDKDEREIEQKTIKCIEAMPVEVKNRFKCLYMLSDRRSKLNDMFSKEVDALELKIRAKKAPHLADRKKIISGEIKDFTEHLPIFDSTHTKLETIVAGIVKTKQEQEDDEADAKEHEPTDVEHLKGVEGIPDFWPRCFKNNKMLGQVIKGDKDKAVFEHLTDVEKVETVTDKKKTIKSTLHFSENEWFNNKELSLSICYKDEEGEEVDKTEGTEIEWKDGKDLTKKKTKKK